jgi:hypothetical protein
VIKLLRDEPRVFASLRSCASQCEPAPLDVACDRRFELHQSPCARAGGHEGTSGGIPGDTRRQVWPTTS